MKKESKENIFEKIISERDYQDHFCTMNNMPLQPTVEGELVMLKRYIDKTFDIWIKSSNDLATLSEIRKIAGISIRCLENHGCPKRDMLKDMIKGNL